MTDRPILFTAPMVRALLAGTKTQTRRVLKADLVEGARFAGIERDGHWLFTKGCAYAKVKPRFVVGDRLWVKETSWIAPVGWTDSPVNPMGPFGQEVAYAADDRSGYTKEAARDYQIKLRPSILMPRWASRLTLTVTDVRVERLQDISEADARAEGIDISPKWSAVIGYETLWNLINGKGAWDANPWVVAVSFDVRRGNIDAPETLTPGPVPATGAGEQPLPAPERI